MIPYHYTFQGFEIGAGHVLITGVFLYYLSMHVYLGFLTILVSFAIGFVWFTYFKDWTYQEMFNYVLIIHVASWIFQFIGHGVFEGKFIIDF